MIAAFLCWYAWHGRVVRGGTGDAEALACRADVVGFLYFEGLLLMRSAANDKLQVGAVIDYQVLIAYSILDDSLITTIFVSGCAALYISFRQRWHIPYTVFRVPILKAGTTEIPYHSLSVFAEAAHCCCSCCSDVTTHYHNYHSQYCHGTATVR